MDIVARNGSHFKVGLTVGKLAARRLARLRVGAADIVLGEALTEQLDEMKGLAMKLGQIVSYMDVPLPDVVQERMARLQSGTRGLDEEATRRALSEAWGEDFETRFDAFDIVPFAAASIGQVHRARYQGRDVVVKLQYPDVQKGFRDDLRSVGRIAQLASLASAVDGDAIVRELGRRLGEECDYEREGRAQAAFRAYFENDRDIFVPQVQPELSTARTLVTEFAVGDSYQKARAFPDKVRMQLAHALIRFNYTSLLCAAAIQADPHPGNFLFRDFGQIVCLDFGCVRIFERRFVELLRRMIRSLRDGDRSLFRETTLALGLTSRPKKFDFEHQFAMMHHLHQPLLSERFQFSSAFVQEGLKYNGPTSPNARFMSMPPAYIWVARLQWGLWSLLARLDAEIEMKDEIERILSEPIVPLVLSNTKGGTD